MSSPPSKCLCLLEMSVHDCECRCVLSGYPSKRSLLVSEDRLEEDVEEEEEKEEEEDVEEEQEEDADEDEGEEDEEEAIEELGVVSEREACRWLRLCR